MSGLWITRMFLKDWWGDLILGSNSDPVLSLELGMKTRRTIIRRYVNVKMGRFHFYRKGVDYDIFLIMMQRFFIAAVCGWWCGLVP